MTEICKNCRYELVSHKRTYDKEGSYFDCVFYVGRGEVCGCKKFEAEVLTTPNYPKMIKTKQKGCGERLTGTRRHCTKSNLCPECKPQDNSPLPEVVKDISEDTPEDLARIKSSGTHSQQDCENCMVLHSPQNCSNKTNTFNLSENMVSHIWIEEKRKELKKLNKEHFCRGHKDFKKICAECQREKGLWFFYPEKDVKEFIKRLKSPSNTIKDSNPKMILISYEDLDKLVGDNLVK